MAEKQIDKSRTTRKQPVTRESNTTRTTISKVGRGSQVTSSKKTVTATEKTKSRVTVANIRPSSSSGKDRVASTKASVAGVAKFRATTPHHSSSSAARKSIEVHTTSKAIVSEEIKSHPNTDPSKKSASEEYTVLDEKFPLQEVDSDHDHVDEEVDNDHSHVDDEPSLQIANSKFINKKNNHKPAHNTMPSNIVEYKGRNYDLAKPIPTKSQLVEDQAKQIEETLNISTLGRDLSSLGGFVHLACCGVVGHTELQIKMRKVLVRVGDITDDTHHALKDFEATSTDALETLETAYGYLKENLEEEAFSLLEQVQESSEEMYKITEELSKKCKEESKNVNELSNETLKEKEATEKQKEETDKLVIKHKLQQKIHEKIITDSSKRVVKMEKQAEETSINEKKVFEEKKKLANETEVKLQTKRESVKQDKINLKLQYDTADSNIEDKKRESQNKYEQALLSNKNLYEEKLEELNSKLNEKIKSAENSYEKILQQNKEKYEQEEKENDKSSENKIEEQREYYRKVTSDAENAYYFAIKRIEKECEDTIETSNDRFKNALEIDKQKLEAELAANKQIFNAQAKSKWTSGSEAKVHAEWAKKDVEAKRIQAEIEDSKRSKNIDEHEAARKCKNRKLAEAFEEKRSKLEKAKEDMDFEIEKLSQKKRESNASAMEKMKKENFTAKSNKDKAISDAENVKRIAEIEAKDKKKNADKLAEDIKKQEDDAYKSQQEHILEKYKLDVQQINKDLENAEEKINEEYKKNLKIIDDEYEHLEKKSARYEANIKENQEKSDTSYQKRLEFIQQIKDGLDLSEGQETSIKCLHEAETALHHIQVIMKDASNFWKDVGRHCKSITLNRQLKLMKTKDPLSRKKVWEGNTFKLAAVKYQAKWVSLKDKCALACKHITSVKSEIRGYICENPTKEVAKRMVQKLAAELSTNSEKMISDKAANS